MNISRPTRVALRFALLMALALCCVLCGCGNQEGQTADEAVEEAPAQEDSSTFVSHGSTYEKAETVAINTTLSGEPTDVSVIEWIKNPDEKDVIEDRSTLKAITPDDEDATFSQDGDELDWQADGADVRYTGTTDQELPFDVSYRYTLDGEEVDPTTLANVTGALEITITYANNTIATVSAGGTSHAVKEPYLMASLVSFDAEHAANVQVDNGQVMDQEGSFMAIGMALPGLSASLGLEGKLDLPEQVTITADVADFDAPDITTIATNNLLSMVDGQTTDELGSTIDEAFEQLSTLQEGISQLAQGTSAVDTALSTIGKGQSQLNEAFPNATSGIASLAEAAQQLSDGATASQTQLNQAGDHQEQALAALASIDTETLTDEQQATLAQATEELTAAQTSQEIADKGLKDIATGSAQLSSGLSSASEGLATIQEGYAQLEIATTQVSQAAAQLSDGTAQLGEGIEAALSQAQSTIDEKIELVGALNDLVAERGAFCGNADDMPASTIFVVTASSQN